MNTDNNNALATANASALGFETIGNTSSDLTAGLTAVENLELQKLIYLADMKAEIAGLPLVNSGEIVGQPFNLLEAIESELNDNGELKPVVNFVCQMHDTKQIICVTKGANKFNLAYCERFGARRGVAYAAMPNMVFVEDAEWGERGNPAIVLRKWQPTATEKSVTPKGDK